MTSCGSVVAEESIARITTGSVKTSDDDKKALAKVSHAHNIANKKFRDLFPEVSGLAWFRFFRGQDLILLPPQYSGTEMKDVPDMGQADKPVSDTPVTSDQSSGSEQSGITDPRQPTGEVNTTEHATTTIRTAGIEGQAGLGTIGHEAQGGWHILNLRWWAMAAFVAFILSRVSSLGNA